MRKISKIMVGAFLFMTIFSLINASNLVFAAQPHNEDIPGDMVQRKLEAHNQTIFTFRNRTRFTFNFSANAQVNIFCDALNIGEKDFQLEVNSEHDLELNMTCTEEQNQLGLMKGNTMQVRNRNRYKYEEGFCISIECNQTQIQARLKILATNQNRDGTWAFYNGTSQEWESVPTAVQNGYLVAETNHFSIWTILIPESEDSIMGYGIIGAMFAGVAMIALVATMLVKRRK